MATKVAVIQKPPVLLDRKKTIEVALASIAEAVDNGASLLVFPEAYIPGYPTWIWRLRPGGDGALSGEIHADCARMQSIWGVAIYSRYRMPPPSTV